MLNESWRERAWGETRQLGHLAVGWKTATTVAVVVFAAACLVWLRDFLATGTLPMLPVLGNASAVTFVMATLAFRIGALAWVLGRSRYAGAVGAVGFGCWVLTALVFQLWLSGSIQLDPMHVTEAEVLAWTLLAGMAAAGLRGPRPRAAAPALGVAVVAALLFTSTGAQPVGGQSSLYMVLVTPAWIPWPLWQGADTLHTSLLVGWALLAVVGLALWRLDPRPALAALWLFPFFAVSQLQVTTIIWVLLAGVAVLAALALGLRQQRISPA